MWLLLPEVASFASSLHPGTISTILVIDPYHRQFIGLTRFLQISTAFQLLLLISSNSNRFEIAQRMTATNTTFRTQNHHDE